MMMGLGVEAHSYRSVGADLLDKLKNEVGLLKGRCIEERRISSRVKQHRA